VGEGFKMDRMLERFRKLRSLNSVRMVTVRMGWLGM